MNWSERIFREHNQEEFEALALDIYHYQKNYCPIYGRFVSLLNRSEPKSLSQIPFLPISFFKSSMVISQEFEQYQKVFKSSGTGNQGRSTHFVADKAIYHESFEKAYRILIGIPEDQVILALLPNYLEQGDSSLVYMVEALIQKSNDKLSAFVLNDFQKIRHHYFEAIEKGKQVVIFGVSYALLDLAACDLDLSKAIVIETGGMKGRRKELVKAELHQLLKNGLKTEKIYSEYGMTELLSQGYSLGDEFFLTPPWMQILIRDPEDPFQLVGLGKTGGINVIDLANVYSCSFIATQDLGRLNTKGFEIMGRFDHSDLRGCNLMVN